jgi:hypothetical protein
MDLHQRVAAPLAYTNTVDTDNPAGGWKAGINDWFIEEIFASPELAPNFKVWASLRLVFPTGRASPFRNSISGRLRSAWCTPCPHTASRSARTPEHSPKPQIWSSLYWHPTLPNT